MNTGIFLGIGSNLGDRRKHLEEAQLLLGVKIASASSFYETEPVGYLEQPWFLNAVIEVETDFSPRKLLERCQEVEQQLGRKRDIPKGPRTVDIDILFYKDVICNEPNLIIPHPAISERRFVLEPLNEIAQDFEHPGLRRTISELLQSCPDRSLVIRRADLNAAL